MFEMGDEIFAVGDTGGAGLLTDAGLKDLLGPTPADPENAFEGGAVDPG